MKLSGLRPLTCDVDWCAWQDSNPRAAAWKAHMGSRQRGLGVA